MASSRTKTVLLFQLLLATLAVSNVVHTQDEGGAEWQKQEWQLLLDEQNSTEVPLTENPTTNTTCLPHGTYCESSSECCMDQMMMCFAEPSHSGGYHDYGQCLCKRPYYWDYKAGLCIEYTGASSTLTITYLLFASFSLVFGLSMLFFACRFGCIKNRNDHLANRHSPQRVLVLSRPARTPRLPVVTDTPPKYDDLGTISKSMDPSFKSEVPPPAYHESLSTQPPPEVTSMEPEFLRSVEGWLQNETSTDATEAGRDNSIFLHV